MEGSLGWDEAAQCWRAGRRQRAFTLRVEIIDLGIFSSIFWGAEKQKKKKDIFGFKMFASKRECRIGPDKEPLPRGWETLLLVFTFLLI